MTLTAPSSAAILTGGGGRSRVLIAVLAVTQTVGYGVLFYAFSVLLTPIAEELSTSAASVTGALTVGIIVAAGASIPIGRWLDRHGGRVLMTVGSALAVVAVVAWSQVRSVGQLYAVFVLMGLASAMSLYEAAFPVVVAATSPARRNNALLAITIVAGFASSIFFPLTGFLLELYGWRHALLILAAILAVITIPAHAITIPKRRQHQANRVRTGASVRGALADRTFWLLTVAFVVHGGAVSAVGVHLVRYLRTAGHPTTVAATLAGLLGVLSVTGRVVTTGLSKRHGITSITAIVFVIQAMGLAALPHLGHTLAGAAACVIAFGLGFGVATIARPAIVADRYGIGRYATIAGAMTLPITLTKAGSPLLAAVLPPNLFARSAAIACLVAAALLWATRSTPDSMSIELDNLRIRCHDRAS